MPQIGVSNNPSLFLGQGTQPFGAEEKWMRILEKKEDGIILYFSFAGFKIFVTSYGTSFVTSLPRGKRKILSMDHSPINQNFELNKSRQKFHHSLKEHHKISNIPKFRCKML